MRKLATIRYINEIIPIKGADRIEIARVDGWNCVVAKNQFKVYDKCVYFEIDSFLPNKQPFISLMPRAAPKMYEGAEGFRIKSFTMSKKLSQGKIFQGLAVPIEVFPDLMKCKLGDDVSENLGVIKYDVAVVDRGVDGSRGGQARGNWPSFLPKTDEERIQNLNYLFDSDEAKEMEFEESLKLDGSSMTVYKVENDFKPGFMDIVKDFLWIKPLPEPVLTGVCSRNVDLIEPDEPMKNNFWHAAYKYNILNDLPIGYAVQGELVAPDIQKNHEKVSSPEYHVYKVWDIKKQAYLNTEYARAFVREELPTALFVPVVEKKVKIFAECSNVDEMLKRVEGVSMNPETVSEGRVYKAAGVHSTLSFKCVSNKYLLKEK